MNIAYQSDISAIRIEIILDNIFKCFYSMEEILLIADGNIKDNFEFNNNFTSLSGIS